MQKNSVNKVFLIGHLGADPEGRYTANGRAVSNFSVATHESWDQDNKIVNHTEWHHVVAWDQLADFAKEYLKKGQLISVEGRLHTRSWTNKEEQTIKITEIIASRITPLGPKKDS